MSSTYRIIGRPVLDRSQPVEDDCQNGRRTRSVKPATADELNVIATRLVDAPNAEAAAALKQKYLAGFYGRRGGGELKRGSSAKTVIAQDSLCF